MGGRQKTTLFLGTTTSEKTEKQVSQKTEKQRSKGKKKGKK